MSTKDDVGITKGVQNYIEQAVKKWRFETIAVHSLYSVNEAINDYQGSIVEPIFMSTSQAFRDSDEISRFISNKIRGHVRFRLS